MKDTFKIVTKALPLPIKICGILAVVLELIIFLVGGISFWECLKSEALVIVAYSFYVIVFHIARKYNEEMFLSYFGLSEAGESSSDNK